MSSDESSVLHKDSTSLRLDEITSMTSYVCECAIHVPVFVFMILDCNFGSDSDIWQRSGMLVCMKTLPPQPCAVLAVLLVLYYAAIQQQRLVGEQVRCLGQGDRIAFAQEISHPFSTGYSCTGAGTIELVFIEVSAIPCHMYKPFHGFDCGLHRAITLWVSGGRSDVLKVPLTRKVLE